MNKFIVTIALSDGRNYIEEVNADDHNDAVLKVQEGETFWEFIGDGDAIPTGIDVKLAGGEVKKMIKNTVSQEEVNACMNNSETHAWWFCENIIDHEGQVGLLHMGFPRLFILMRNYDAAYWAGFNEWRRDLIEVTFMERDDEESTSYRQFNELLISAWNFLAKTEEADEEWCEDDDE